MPEQSRNTAKVAVLISGTGTNMAALLYASRLPKSAYQIILVGSNNPGAAGLKLAEAEGIPTFAHSHKGMDRAEHDALMERAIIDAGAEYIILAGYMRILSDGFVDRWQGRMLNIHPSLLPKYRGLDTHQRAIDAGDREAGASVHLVSHELDAGEVLGQLAVTIQPGDTSDDLAERVRFAEHQLYPLVVNDYVGRAYDTDWLLSKIRTLALDLPEAEERESHGCPGWRTGGKSGKYFAYFNDHHFGSKHISVLVKTGSMDELLSLCEAQPDTYFKPAYYGASGWIGIILNRPGVDWDHVADWLQRSWQSLAPKRLTKLMNAADEF